MHTTLLVSESTVVESRAGLLKACSIVAIEASLGPESTAYRELHFLAFAFY